MEFMGELHACTIASTVFLMYLTSGECETGFETSCIWPAKVEPGYMIYLPYLMDIEFTGEMDTCGTNTNRAFSWCTL